MGAPVCPRCMGRGDLLARMGDEREWRCEDCGHEWTTTPGLGERGDLGGEPW